MLNILFLQEMYIVMGIFYKPNAANAKDASHKPVSLQSPHSSTSDTQ